MRAPSKYLPGLVVLGMASVLRAQAPAPAPATPAPDPNPGAADSLEARRKTAASLSVTDMQDKSAAMMAQMPEDYRHVMYLKEQAKKGKDVVKLTCVNDKLIQLKAQQEIADTTNADLQASLRSGTDGRVILFVNLQDTSAAITKLRGDADVCAGATELFKQESGGVTVEAPDLPDPTTAGGFGAGVDAIEPPAYASPFN